MAQYGQGGATLVTADEILKEVYEPGITDQLENEVTALKRVTRTSEGIESNVGGKYVVFPIHVSRNSGIGARLEDEDLPTPGAQGYDSGRVPLRYQYGRLRLTGQAIALADTNAQAFASVMEEETTRIKDDLAKDLNRQVYGDGTGTIATITGALTGNVAPIDKGAQWLQEGMKVDTGTIADGVVTIVATNKLVSNVTENADGTGTVTLTGGTGTPVNGHVIVRAGNATTTGPAQREWTGLRKIVASGDSLFNIDGATVSLWNGVINANGGTNRALTENLITTTADSVRRKGGMTSVMFMNLGVRRAYANLLTSLRRYVGTTEFKGGFSGIAFAYDKGDIPMVVDTDCPRNSIYGLSEKEIKVYRENDWSFMNRDGSRWARVSNRDAYEATLYQYSELGTHRRQSHFLLADITEA